MIRYALKCSDGHDFDSWFRSADGFDSLLAGGMVACAVCGSTAVAKALMAPALRGEPGPRPLDTPASKTEAALAALRRQVAENAEYVGMNFAAEARAIHDGAAPERAIYGEAKVEEARRLIADGVPVAPLPFLPVRKAN